jgi:hypothetical protein
MVIAVLISSLLVLLITPVLLIRFRKRWVAAFNLAVTNRITSRFANRLTGLGMTHVGRKSGRVYRTPVNVFRTPEGFLIALTYGRDSEWVKNVLSAGGCQLETRRVLYQVLVRLIGPLYGVPTGPPSPFPPPLFFPITRQIGCTW